MSYATTLSVDLAGIPLRNPVLLAAGASGTLDEFGDVLDLSRIGGVVGKSITRLAREGNPTWRIVELRAGMLNAVGLANPGIEKFEQVYLPRAGGMPCAVFGSVAGFGVDDYVVVCAAMDEWGRRPVVGGEGAGSGEVPRANPASASLDGVELNVSCPNVKTGCTFSLHPGALRELVVEVRKVMTRTRLIVKLSPMVTDLNEMAKAAIDAGADALTISNTLPAMAIDVRTRSPRLANTTGGMSGPGLHPVAVRLVYECYTRVCKDGLGRGRGVPIIGAGGVLTWEDAAEFILAGASAVQMGTGLFVDPRSPLKVARGLEKWVRAQGCASIGELVGAVKV
jgi:dihydroorotate dehydrogenase (NAD+) catalytic subunit